jgi:hypothetical protein
MAAGDPSIERFVDKGYPDWPYVAEDKGIEKLTGVLDGEQFIKSISISARFDNEIGISAVFPLLIIKGVNDPITGGWFVNRLYFKGDKLQDIGWNIIYTPSASRWIDSYFSAGAEWNHEDDGVKTYFATEAGLKLRFNIAHSPVSFMSKLTDFWGLRAGIRYLGYKSFSEIGYVIEVGAGTF